MRIWTLIIIYSCIKSFIEYGTCTMLGLKESLGFIDFIRGKYSLNDQDYILNIIKQMTNAEKML